MSEVSIGVRELKTRLSEYLRKARAGQVVVITQHGRPIVYMTSAPKTLDEKTQAMIDAGLMEWNGQKLKPMKPVVRNRSKKQVSDIVIENRE